MKKIAYIIALSMMFNTIAQAETIIVVDENNIVKQQIVTSQPQPVYVSTQPQQVVVTTQPQPVVVTQPQPVVVTQPVVIRETPVVNSYYYDPVATAAIAGVTGVIIGSSIFSKSYHHHDRRPMPPHGGHGGHGGMHR